MYRQNVIKINEMRVKWWASDTYCRTGSVFLLVNNNTELFLLTCCCRYFLLLLLFLFFFFFFSSFSPPSVLVLLLFLLSPSPSSLLLHLSFSLCAVVLLPWRQAPRPLPHMVSILPIRTILRKCLLQVCHDGAYKFNFLLLFLSFMFFNKNLITVFWHFILQTAWNFVVTHFILMKNNKWFIIYVFIYNKQPISTFLMEQMIYRKNLLYFLITLSE